ncbi:MAG: hypothetical protein ABIZ04_09570 [Opitutus sp.]
MNSPTAVFRANPSLMVAVILCLAIPLVLTLVGAIMRSSGASLRPMVFMAVLMLPVTLPLLIGALVSARTPGGPAGPTVSLPTVDGHFADRQSLFGADLRDSDMRDAKSIFPEFFAEAEVAELALVGTGETALAAQFPTAEAAKRASASLWRTFQMTGTSGDEERGWRGKRRQNSDYIELLRSGRLLFFWTGLKKESAAAHRAASTLPTAAIEASRPAPLIPALQPLGAFFKPPAMKAIGLVLLVCLYTGWFFKGAAWAASSPSVPGVSAVSPGELAARLEAINQLDVPFRIERGERPNEYFATWRYADAKWIDLARAHGLRRTFRIRLALDPKGETVRATDYVAGYDWSAGAPGARIAWQATLGLMFFQVEQGQVFGLQLDDRGNFQPALSYSYKFDLNEMKSPLIAATTRAGWKWRPTVWQGPVWLRWLTE